MSRGFPWNRLGIDATTDTAAIRKAYADVLRATDVDDDIAGYAELRRARDHALWLAAQSQRAEADDGDDLGLGDLDDAWNDAWDDDQNDSPAGHHPGLAAPTPAPELTESQLHAQAAWKALLGVLYPDDAASDEAVTLEEQDQACAALDVLIARADEADLAEHDALDDGLAELLARTWPRSAPLVEQANAAFGWLDEAGVLDERPALMFLNQRLEGMRFHAKVQQPDHPLHKAWSELSRPGRAGVLDRLKVKRLDVHKLLTGIRERYPELESYLDPERIASWDTGTGEGNPGGLGPRIVRGIVIALLVVALPRLISAFTGPDVPDFPAPEAQGPRAAETDALVVDIFGQGTDMAAVRAADPALAGDLEPMADLPDAQGRAMLAYVRMKALASSAVADEANLTVRADLRSLWMRSAQRQSDAVCRKVMTGNFIGLDPDLGLTDTERDRERALLRQLLDAGLLGQQVPGGDYRYNIRGWLLGDTVGRSGLAQETLVAALTDPDHPDRCRAEAALIEAVRASPKPVPLDVLRGL